MLCSFFIPPIPVECLLLSNILITFRQQATTEYLFRQGEYL